MSINPPFVRTQARFLFMLPKLLLLVVLFVFFYPLSHDLGVFYGCITYLIILYTLRLLIPRSFRKGIILIKQNRFEDAIGYFKKSRQFFTTYSWVDKYRCVTLLSSSNRCYMEISMCNEAFALSQIKRGAEAILIYHEVLEKFPESNIAATALKMLESVR